jgi:ribosomal protein L32E
VLAVAYFGVLERRLSRHNREGVRQNDQKKQFKQLEWRENGRVRPCHPSRLKEIHLSRLTDLDRSNYESNPD